MNTKPIRKVIVNLRGKDTNVRMGREVYEDNIIEVRIDHGYIVIVYGHEEVYIPADLIHNVKVTRG